MTHYGLASKSWTHGIAILLAICSRIEKAQLEQILNMQRGRDHRASSSNSSRRPPFRANNRSRSRSRDRGSRGGSRRDQSDRAPRPPPQKRMRAGSPKDRYSLFYRPLSTLLRKSSTVLWICLDPLKFFYLCFYPSVKSFDEFSGRRLRSTLETILWGSERVTLGTCFKNMESKFQPSDSSMMDTKCKYSLF